MGRDKALIEWGGQRLADRAAARLAEVCEPVVEVGPGHSALAAVREDPPGSGPLAALGTGWDEIRRRGHPGPVLALAVDMPGVDADLLGFLARAPGAGTVVPRVAGRPQPLCARYGAPDLDLVAGLLADGDRSLRALLAVAAVAWLDEAAWEPVAGAEAFDDLDTPEDLGRFPRP